MDMKYGYACRCKDLLLYTSVLNFLHLSVVSPHEVNISTSDFRSESGKPLRLGTSTGPLGAGLDTFPIGIAIINDGSMPDLFVLNTRKHSDLAPAGIYVYKYHSSAEDVPIFTKHPKGLAEPPVKNPTDILSGSVTQLASGEVVAFWVVKEKGSSNRVLRSLYKPELHSFNHQLSEVGLKLPENAHAAHAWFLPCQPRVGRQHCALTNGGDLFLERVSPSTNRAPADAHFMPFTAQGAWRGGPTPLASLYHVRLRGSGKGAESHTPTLATRSRRSEERFSYCSLFLMPVPEHLQLPSDHPLNFNKEDSSRRRKQKRAAEGQGRAPGVTNKNVVLISGSVLGVMSAYRISTGAGGGAGGEAGTGPRHLAARQRSHMKVEKLAPLRSNGTAVLRHPSIQANVIGYPGLEDPALPRHLLGGGEGALYWYKRQPSLHLGVPNFDAPVFAMEHAPLVYAGSLPAPAVGDWDGDGAPDVLVGNSEGRVLFFKNLASDDLRLQPGAPVWAGGQAIHVQLSWAIQGPEEARYGYTSPVLVDWDGDGLLDLMLGDATAVHKVFLNRGTAKSPRLAYGVRLEVEGMPLRGSWRVKPGVAMVGFAVPQLVLVSVDDAGALHAYLRLDDTNLADGGRLQLVGGDPIFTSVLDWPGSYGRLSVMLRDFDLDGVLDLVLGTHRMSSVPDPKLGLPHAIEGKPGAAILFLRGVRADAHAAGSDGKKHKPPPLGVQFKFPEVMRHDGQEVYFGSHRCTPEAVDMHIQGVNGPHLLVGEEGGRLHLLLRSRLSVREAYPEGFPTEPSQDSAQTVPAVQHVLDVATGSGDGDALTAQTPDARSEAPLHGSVETSQTSPIESSQNGHPKQESDIVAPVARSDVTVLVQGMIMGVTVTATVVVMLKPLRQRFCSD